jgi:hypothetical protein
LLENYEFKQNRTDPRRHVKRLAEVFGGMRAEEITEARIREYSRKRLEKDRMTPPLCVASSRCSSECFDSRQAVSPVYPS